MSAEDIARLAAAALEAGRRVDEALDAERAARDALADAVGHAVRRTRARDESAAWLMPDGSLLVLASVADEVGGMALIAPGRVTRIGGDHGG